MRMEVLLYLGVPQNDCREKIMEWVQTWDSLTYVAQMVRVAAWHGI